MSHQTLSPKQRDVIYSKLEEPSAPMPRCWQPDDPGLRFEADAPGTQAVPSWVLPVAASLFLACAILVACIARMHS